MDTLAGELPGPKRTKRARSGFQKQGQRVGKSDAQLVHQAVQIAADMEMGYYVDPEGHQWDARPFVITQIMRHMGYSEALVLSHNPSWWPGQDTVRRMVQLTVLMRRAQMDASSGLVPWLDAALAASAEELLRRLYVAPQSIASRELVDLSTKLARLGEERRRAGGGNGAPLAIPPGASVMQRITETIALMPAEDQERAKLALTNAVTKMQEALPA